MRLVAACIAVIWISALTINLPYVFTSFATRRGSYFTTWHGYVYPALHTACCFLLLTIYTHISVTTYQQLNKISKLKPQLQRDDTQSSIIPISKRSFQAENWKAVKLLILICGLYFIFVSPYVYFLAYTQVNLTKAYALRNWSWPLLILMSIYHCSNFFVYALRMRQFRRAVKHSFRKFVCCRNNRVWSETIAERSSSIFELQSRTRRSTETEVLGSCVIP